MTRTAALLFGLNYAHSSCELSGCINDVKRMSTWLSSQGFSNIKVFTDRSNPAQTTKRGIIKELRSLSKQSHEQNLDLVFIHYSGHGTQVADSNGDEKDRKDEALVPSDHAKRGMITDDVINSILAKFNPKTKIVWIIDACHSATCADLKFKYVSKTKMSIENRRSRCKGKVITLSGCKDSQTSSDAYDVMHKREFSGALTSCFLLTVKKCGASILDDSFLLIKEVRKLLRQKKFSQIPQLCSSYDLSREPKFL